MYFLFTSQDNIILTKIMVHINFFLSATLSIDHQNGFFPHTKEVFIKK